MLFTIHNYIWASILVSWGGLLFGFDTGIIGPITSMPGFTEYFGEFSEGVHGLIVSSILLPAAFSSFFAGHLADKVGRLNAVMIGAAIFACGAGLEAGAVHLAMLIIGRATAGVGEGFFLSTVVVYICEICPPQKRGPIASLVQMLTTLGIPAGYFTCLGSVRIDSSLSWRIPFIVQAVLATMLACCCPFLPSSPRWLIERGHPSQAGPAMDRLELSLAELRKELESANAPSEDVAGATAPAQVSSKRLLRVFNKNNRRQALFAAFLMGMMQWSGIDGVLYYAPTLFAQAGLSSTQSSFLASGITGIVILISTIPASLLSDKWGRRASALWGAATLSACMILVGSLYAANQVHNGQGAARWVVIVTIYLFTIAYSVTWSIGFKLYASEIQPAQTRAAASSLAQSANWVCNWIVALITPILLARSSCGAYFLFGSLTLFTGLVCLVYMPESRGRSIDTVHRSFEQSLPERLSAIIRSRWHERKGGNDRGSAACRFDSGVKMSQVSDSGSSQA